MERRVLGKRRRSEQREGLRKDTKIRSNPLQCPICDVTLRPESLTQHYEQELSKLEQLQPHSAHHRSREPRPSTSSSAAEEGTEGEGGILNHAKKTLESVQRRRFLFEHRSHDQSSSLPQQSHDQSSSHQSQSNSGDGERGMCPVCNVLLPPEGGGAAHIDACLEQQRTLEEGMLTLSSQNSVDDESSGSEEYEEYTWCNMTRIRTTSLLSPQTRASMFNASVISRPSDTSFEESVDVEEDSSALYGPPQFGEEDILTVSDESEAQKKDEACERSPRSVGVAPCGSDEDGVKKTQCLICMDHYENPLVSVLCWHVYCECCWLKALKAQKLCPKCKTITCASDLRRIFL